VFTQPVDGAELVWFDQSGNRAGSIATKGSASNPRISPDGTRVVVGVIDRRTGLGDLWIYGIDRPTSMRLTTEATWEDNPVWSADGSTVYYSCNKNDYPEIFSIRADGSGDAKPVYGPESGGRVWYPRSASPDGQSLLVSGFFDKLATELRVIALGGDAEAKPFRSTPANEYGARFSPDGQWVAFGSDESGRPEVYIAPSNGEGPKVQVSTGGTFPVWGPRGDRLYYIQVNQDASADPGQAKIMVVDLSSTAAFTAPPPASVALQTPGVIASFEITPDGQRFLVALGSAETPPICVILNGLPRDIQTLASASR
jgi:serine/threonine-protein kinase